MSMLLEIENVTVQYGKALALEDVSLTVGEGEVVSILGANGAGKTTIAKIVTGSKKITKGTICFQGERIDGLPAYKVARKGIALIPSGRMIFGSMTVQDNLRMGAFTLRDRKRIQTNMEKVYAYFPVLKEKRNQAGGELSGGQQQMLAIGRALMSEPRLLVMDEPSMGLSPVLVSEVAEVIKTLHEAGNSILLVEQNSRMALKVSGRAYVLQLGHVVLENDAQALLADERVQKSYFGQ